MKTHGKQDIDDFLKHKTITVAGMSRSGGKFANHAVKELLQKGYRILAVHPQAETVDGLSCSKSVSDLKGESEALFVCLPPEQARQVVTEAAAAGFKYVWLQQGAESEAAVNCCRENGMSVISGECILMFAEPAGFGHRLHRGLWRWLGKLPD